VVVVVAVVIVVAVVVVVELPFIKVFKIFLTNKTCCYNDLLFAELFTPNGAILTY